MSTLPPAATTAATAATNPATQVSGSPVKTEPTDNDAPPVNWDSEIQLVSSLAKLQELERQIHELRQFIPDGLLEPLVPMSTTTQSSSKQAVESPPAMHGGLERAARDRLASIQQFQSEWRAPEMKPVWAHVESRIKESNGQHLQPTGMWEKDYDVLLKELSQAEKSAEEERKQGEEDAERAKAQSSDADGQAMVGRFINRNVPGVRVIKGQNATSLAVALARAVMVFLIQGIKEPDAPGVSRWETSSKVAPGRAPTKLELAILDCLNSRPRKWDLAFLLDMISSYADFKQTPCSKCNKLTNNAAQLPIIRRAQSTQPSPSETGGFAFDAFHTGCA